MLKNVLLISIVAIATQVSAQDSDTTKPTDTLQVLDTTSVADTTSSADTLRGAEKALQGFIERQKQRQQELAEEEIIEVEDYISFYDSLLVYLLSDRLSQRNKIRQFSYRDAGDYFRYSPSAIVMDYQHTPMRKTVQPFSLTGDRTNFVSNGLVLNPFEHFIEPDGLVDYNDIPTALDHDVYLLPGGSGQIFGGSQSIATYLSVPKQPDSLQPESSFDIEKASFDYAYTKGRYVKNFTNGKYVDFSLEYRKTDGLRFFSNDNSYQYTGTAIIPITQTYYFKFSGNTLKRESAYVIEPDVSSNYFTRNRTDRNAQFTFERHNELRTVKYSVGYLYQKKKSYISRGYTGRFHYHNDGVFVKRESIHGNNLVKAEVDTRRRLFKNGIDEYDRYSVRPSLSILKKSEKTSIGLTTGFEYMEIFRFLPFASILFKRETDNTLWSLSAGYSEKAPTLYQLHLPYQQAAVYGSSIDYADVGNEYLGSEKQLTGSITFVLGDTANNINVSVTGGQIFDGIDWYQYDTTLNGTFLKLFEPENSDIRFVDMSVTPQFKFFKLFKATLGGAFHFKDHTIKEIIPYSPEYNMFANIEMHVYWAQKMIDFFGYGEVTYSGPYKGYNGDILGETPVLNFGVSAELGSFRFHYIFLNSTEQLYSVRENNQYLGRFTYYGFTWNFLD